MWFDANIKESLGALIMLFIGLLLCQILFNALIIYMNVIDYVLVNIGLSNGVNIWVELLLWMVWLSWVVFCIW